MSDKPVTFTVKSPKDKPDVKPDIEKAKRRLRDLEFENSRLFAENHRLKHGKGV